jgi:hypothetical protein
MNSPAQVFRCQAAHYRRKSTRGDLKTAKSLDIDILPMLLAGADELIE